MGQITMEHTVQSCRFRDQDICNSDIVFGVADMTRDPGLSFYDYIDYPNPKMPRRPHTKGLKPHQLKTPTQKPNSEPRPANHN